MKNKKQITLALQGGGAHGAFTWGILDRFLEKDLFTIEGISSTSAGSMNAVVLAQGMMEGGPEKARELLDKFWKTISERGEKLGLTSAWPIDFFLQAYTKIPMSNYLFSEFINLFSPYQFNPFNEHPIKDVLESMIDVQKIKNKSKIKLFLCATNVVTGKIKIFDNKEISINAILASACLPELFQAVEVNNEYYWDGGYLGNPAIFPLIYHTSSPDVIILHTVPFVRHEIPKTIIEIRTRLREISFNSSLSREMRAIAFISRMLEENWFQPEYGSKLKKCYFHCLNADETMREFSYESVLYPDWDFLLKLKELGRKAADKWLEKNFDKVGNQSTLDFDEWL